MSVAPALPTFAVSSGSCRVTADGACFRSPNYPEHYISNYRTCAIAVAGAGVVRSTAFATWPSDYLTIGGTNTVVRTHAGPSVQTIGGTQYNGDGGALSLTGVVVSDGESIARHCDGFSDGAGGFEVCNLEHLASICHEHGSWDGSACSTCRDNFIGDFCTESCGEHGMSYVISGSRGTSHRGNLDGTYSLVEAHCKSMYCDAGSPTTCAGAPAYQKDGARGGGACCFGAVGDGICTPATPSRPVAGSSARWAPAGTRTQVSSRARRTTTTRTGRGRSTTPRTPH